MALRARRKFTASGRFNCNAVTVARPAAVRPITCSVSSLQAKWRVHDCRRGLNKRTRRRVCGSRAWVLACLWPLQAEQAQASSSSVSPAPKTRGQMCSPTNGPLAKSAEWRQYSQRLPALSRSWRRTLRGDVLEVIGLALPANVSHHLAGRLAAPLRQFGQGRGALRGDGFGSLGQPAVLGQLLPG